MVLSALTALVIAAGSLHGVDGVAALEEPGWRPVLASDFAVDGRLPEGCEPFVGPHDGVAASHYLPDEVTVSDGTLRLGLRRRDREGRPYTSGGIGCYDLAQRYGRYEFRARPPRGAGLDAYLTLRPADGGDASLVELLARPDDERVYVTNGGRTLPPVRGPVADDFHTYVVEWGPAGFRVAVDGREVAADPATSGAVRWVGFGLSTGDALTGLPDAGTGLPAEFAIDWLRIWAYEPSAGARAGTPAVPLRTDGGLGAPAWWLVVGAVVALLGALTLVAVRLRPSRSRHRM